MAYVLADHLGELGDVGVAVEVYAAAPAVFKDFPKHELLSHCRTSVCTAIPESDGFIGAFRNQTTFVLAIGRALGSTTCVVVTQPGLGNILTRLPEDQNLTFDDHVFHGWTCRKVGTKAICPVHNGVAYTGVTTQPGMNAVRVIAIRKQSYFFMYEIAIVTRVHEGVSKHFLTVQRQYEGNLYADPETGLPWVDESSFPGYRQWDSLQDILKSMVTFDLPERLPDRPSTTLPSLLREGVGRVKYFTMAGGHGRVILYDGREAFLYWGNLKTSDRNPYLFPGQLVTYDQMIENDKGPQILSATPVLS